MRRYLLFLSKQFLAICLLLYLSFLFPQTSKVFAQDKFSVSSDVTYAVNEKGTTHVVLKFNLINTTSDSYASAYKIQVGFDSIQNVSASDPDGSITPVLKKTNEGYLISIDFNKHVVGIGKNLFFVIAFDTTKVAQKNGSIWEINIPGLAQSVDFGDFNVFVIVPRSFGGPTYIKPNYLATLPTNGGTTLHFTKEQLQRSGISIGYGEKQLYKFRLIYHLKNNNLFPVKTEIALPPSTNYQNISIDSISVPPLNVTEDSDGNWLAAYSLVPSEKKEIEVLGKAELFLTPKPMELSNQDLKKYLAEKSYWQVSNSEIEKLSKSLKTPKEIYNYVVKNLHYDFSRVSENKPRLGAVAALQNPASAVCLEFTDLFIALARSAGIPAREVNGFAYTENSKQRPLSLVKDILHAWPEYYDKNLKTWKMIDPTWGNTTGGVDYFDVLDFDHVAFVIKGEDSDYPIPAGGYKTVKEINTKDVYVSYSDSSIDTVSRFEINANLPNSILSYIPLKGFVTIKNIGKIKLEPQSVSIRSKNLFPSSQSMSFRSIPPYGFTTMPFGFQAASFLTNTRDTITIQINDKTFIQSVQIAPFFLTKEVIIGGVLIVIFSISILYFTPRTRRISVPESKQ